MGQAHDPAGQLEIELTPWKFPISSSSHFSTVPDKAGPYRRDEGVAAEVTSSLRASMEMEIVPKSWSSVSDNLPPPPSQSVLGQHVLLKKFCKMNV